VEISIRDDWQRQQISPQACSSKGAKRNNEASGDRGGYLALVAASPLHSWQQPWSNRQRRAVVQSYSKVCKIMSILCMNRYRYIAVHEQFSHILPPFQAGCSDALDAGGEMSIGIAPRGSEGCTRVTWAVVEIRPW